MINIMELGIHTLGPRISVIETDDIFGKCLNLLGRVTLGQALTDEEPGVKKAHCVHFGL